MKDVIHSMFTYLGLVETLGNYVTDIIVILLVANGIDFHIESPHSSPRIKHALSIESLENEKVPLATKLNFLRENSVSTLTSLFDSKLRNDIAHLKFVLKDNNIYFKGGRGLKLAQAIVPDTSVKLMEGIDEVCSLLGELAEKEGWEED